MAGFANLIANLNLNMQGFTSGIRRASTIVQGFSANMQGQINAGMVDPIKEAKFEFKDVSRIVQGIMISKTFYSGLNAIRRAKDAVWEFSKELEYAHMVYSNLFGDSDLAAEFINVLKDFAAVTPFSFKQSEAAAKRLLAYGVEYKNIMYVMQGVLAAATVQGNDAIIEPISRALGQIYTKGRLMNEEMRQLAEAGIPAYEILQEKLGLTEDELRNLGRTAVPASVAINALIDGINERFGSTLIEANQTTQGIISNIADNSVMLFSSVLAPLSANIKEGLRSLGAFIGELRGLQEVKGFGGVFERIIPPELQNDVRIMVANFRLLGSTLSSLASSVLRTFGYALVGILRVFNALAPALNLVGGILAAMIQKLTSNESAMRFLTTAVLAGAAAWVVFKIQALSATVISGMILMLQKAVVGLITALNFLVRHPIWVLLALGAGIFVSLTGSSEKFRASINGIAKSLYSMSGMDTSSMFMPEAKDRAADVGKFNNALTGTKDGMDALGKSTEKASKAAKSLLSFDEVFKLNTKDEGNAAGDIDGLNLPDVNMPNIKIPDVSKMVTDFVGSMLDNFTLNVPLLSAGIGALIGKALGTLIGGPIGGNIGMALGGLAGWFWPEVAKYLGLSDLGAISLPIATSIGAAIGFIAGGPAGAVIGAAIGALVGFLVDGITKGIKTGDWSKVAMPIGIGLGAAIGLVVGGPAGAAIGAAIGLMVGWFGGELVKGFTTGKWDTGAIGLGIGTAIGAAIGMVMGGPAGAAIGAVIGSTAGLIVGKFWNEIVLFLGKPVTQGSLIGSLIGGVIGLFFGPVGFFVGAAIGGAASGVVTKYWDDIVKFVKQTPAVQAVLGVLLQSTLSLFFGPLSGFVKAGIEGAANGTIKKYWDSMVAILGKNPTVGSVISTLIGGLIGLIFGPKAALVGAAIGKAANDIFIKFWNDVKGKHTVGNVSPFKIDSAIALVVTAMFGPKGALLVAIGNAAKDLVTSYWSQIKSSFNGLDWNIFGKGKIDVPNTSAPGSNTGSNQGTSNKMRLGHATGGVFNREHVARFAEGNKAEAIIPLENNTAMKPFVDAVSNGITSALMPMFAAMSGNQQQLQPVYVGTLIADDRSLKELSRKMDVIQLEERARRG